MHGFSFCKDFSGEKVSFRGQEAIDSSLGSEKLLSILDYGP